MGGEVGKLPQHLILGEGHWVVVLGKILYSDSTLSTKDVADLPGKLDKTRGEEGERTCNGLKCHPGVRRVAIILMVTLCCGKPDKFCAAGQLAGEDLTFFFFSYFSFSMRRRGDTPVMICYLTPFFSNLIYKLLFKRTLKLYKKTYFLCSV